jgi:hypothetical protein
VSLGAQTFPMRGGLDLESPPTRVPPGRVVACLNHESTPNGYQRTEGYERFDGRTAPSTASFSILTFTTGVSAFVANETITGFTSGATARVVALADVQAGTFGGGNAAGRLAIVPLTGVFTVGELLKVGGTTRATLATLPVAGDPQTGPVEQSWLVAAQTYLRNIIQPLDTVGGIRGVVVYNNLVYAFSDAGGVGNMYIATSAGWSLKVQKSSLKFSGGVYKPTAGPTVADTLTGVTSGATCKVRYIALDSGDYGTSDAAGLYVVDTVVGTFQVGEQIRHSVGEIAGVVVAIPTAITLPQGGRYSFEIFNFRATGITATVYGANGVGQAFEFDGNNLIAPISTGTLLDVPLKIAEHKNQLCLTLPSGSLQLSVAGQPRNFSGVAGATEIGVGSDITNLIPNTDDVMVIFTATRTNVLTGNDSSDFLLSQQGGNHAGAKPYTAQKIGQVIYLDTGGVRSIAATQFGNFKLGSYTTMIDKLLVAKQKAGITPVASCVVKSKSQYLLFFSDGSGVSLFFAAKSPEPMTFQYPFIERVFVGATNGYVYELNKGTSFDGALIPAYVQFPFFPYGNVRLNKRFVSLEAEVSADAGTILELVAKFNNDDGEQPYTIGDDLSLIAGDTSSAAPSNQSSNIEWYLDGTGFSLSPSIISNQSSVASYTLSAITVLFRGRGQRR